MTKGTLPFRVFHTLRELPDKNLSARSDDSLLLLLLLAHVKTELPCIIIRSSTKNKPGKSDVEPCCCIVAN
jgi:hypothetical protein